MKKLILYTLALLSTMSFFSCSDDDSVSSGADREFMTMFRKDDNTGKGDTDPYNCQVENMNDVHLYWYGVTDCAGYEIKMALQPNVSSGLASDWENPDYILLDTIVGPDVLDMQIKDLQYQTDYRFAIRTLSKRGEAYNSKWYGYGSGRQWADYLGLTTENRYDVPEVIYASEITKTTLRINIDRVVANSGDDNSINGFKQHFNTENYDGNEVYTMQYLEVGVGNDNPNAVLPEKWVKYQLTDEDFQRGYVDIDGLEQNSVYTVNVEDTQIPTHWDAVYNTVSVRMDGEPGDPILIPWVKDTVVDPLIPGTIGNADYDASRLDTIINNYNQNSSLAEGQIFYLEGGKTYYFAQNTSLYKGFTLATNPADLAAGKGRAKVLLGGTGIYENNPNCNNFMLGRQPQSGESPAIRINVKKLSFEDIDFDCPLAKNFGKNSGTGTGNYFANMYSNGMGVQISSFEIHRCSFQNMIRGFVRVQGTAVKVFENFIVEDCDFYNDGYYDNNGRGYAWIAGDGKQAKSNIFQNMVFRNNTFYDSPRTCMFTDGGKELAWPSSVTYNITLENNTFVNFSTRSSGRKIFDFKYLPGGSRITIKNNLFILAKQDGDSRPMFFEGANIQEIEGSGLAYFDISNNWSTNTNLISNQIFSGGSFAATKKSFGAFGDDAILNGRDELQVHVDDITPEELMVSPDPPHKATDALMHNVDNLNGLYFNTTEKVLNSNIYKLNIGASKWRTGSTSAKRNSYISPYIRR
nr:hypothetical protein [Prevotella sp.]